MPLHVEMRKERDITVIQISGLILAQDGAAELKKALQSYLDEGLHDLLLEVDGVDGVDESGVGTLCQVRTEAKKAGGDLRISGANYSFLAALALHSTACRFPYYQDREQALNSFGDQDQAAKGVRRFDILEFVQEQEREEAGRAAQPETESTV